MKRLILLIFIGIVIQLSSNPILAQTADITKACAPVKIKFTAPPGFNTWFWDFKDGVTSDLEVPEHVFTDAGNYIVEFKENSNGTIIGSILIIILSKPDIKVNVSPLKGCVPIEVSFSDATNYSPDILVNYRNWVFGDGAFSNGNLLKHKYQSSGIFDLSLEIKTNLAGCDITQIFKDKIEVFPLPEPKIITEPDPPASCLFPFDVTFSENSKGNGPFIYNWSFGNGNVSNVSKPEKQTYTLPGSYPVSLKLEDINGCISTVNSNVLVGLAKISVKFPDTVCLDNSFLFENKSGVGSHKWDFGPNSNPGTSNDREPSVSYSTPGWKEIHYTLTTGNGMCKTDTIFKVYVLDINTAFPIDYDQEDCKSPITFQFDYIGPLDSIRWMIDKYAIYDIKNPLFIYPFDKLNYSVFGKRKLNITVNVYSQGCNVEKMFELPINLLTSCYTVDKYQGCAPLGVQFGDCSYSKQKITKWIWDFDDGQVFVTTDSMPPFHTYKDCGTYHPVLTIENSAGCIDTSYRIEIKVCGGSCLPVIPPFTCTGIGQPPLTICHGDVVNFVINADTFWKEIRLKTDNSRLFHCPEERMFSWKFDHEPGLHNVEATGISTNGDELTLYGSNAINVLGAWAQGHYMIQDCAHSNTVMFKDVSQNATEIRWVFPDGQSSTSKNVTHTFNSGGHQTVLLIALNDIDGCPPDTTSFNIYTGNINPKINLETNYCAGSIQLEMNGSSYVSCFDGIKWTFDNDTTPVTTASNPAFKDFFDAGLFEATLHTFDENGCPYTDKKTFRINTVEAIIKSLPDKICLPYDLQLIDQSVAESDPIVSYEWIINGKKYSTDKNFNIKIDGAFPLDSSRIMIILKVKTALGCEGQSLKIINVYKPVSEILTDEDHVYCQNELINLDAIDYHEGGSYLDFLWKFGNGNSSTDKETQISYKDPGVYIVSLIYTEHTTGCKDSSLTQFTIQGKPNADFETSVDNEPVLCYPKNVYFKISDPNNSGLTYNWSFGNGQSSNLPEPGTVYNKGNFTASLILQTSAGCADTSYHSFVLVGPEGNYSFDKTAICKGEEIILTLSDTVEVGGWLWDLGDGIVISGMNPIKHTYTILPPGDTTIVKLVLSDLTGTCTYSVEKILPIVNIIADFELEGNISLVCPGSTVKLINKSKRASSYLWKFPEGPTTTLESPNIKFTTKGFFNITLIAYDSIAGCIDSITKTIEVRDLSIEDLQNNVVVCPGDTALIGLSFPKDSSTYFWMPQSTLSDPFNYQTFAFPKTETTYTLIITQANGCTAIGNVTVSFFKDYAGQALFIDSVAQGTAVTLKVPVNDSSYTFKWEPSNLLSCSNCPNPIYIADTSATFKVTITDKLGCGTSQIEYRIKVIPDKIIVPNVFTPNGDNKNDNFQFFIPGGTIADLGLRTFKIYSRWGELVYDNAFPDKGWDGTFKGKPCPEDVYVYSIEVNFFTGKIEHFQGEVTLVR